jgi:hypothetical protein
VSAEAIAVLEGIKSILPVNDKPVIVESDNAAMVNELKGSEMCKSESSLIILEAKNILDNFPGVRFEKVKRECNTAAHNIAKYSFREWCGGVLFGSIPPGVKFADPKVCNGVCNNDLDR